MRLLDRSLPSVLAVIAIACSSPSAENPNRVGAGPAAAPGGSLQDALVAASGSAGQWTQTNWTAGNDFFKLFAGSSRVFARTWDSLDGGRVFSTSDDGATWTQVASADTDLDILSIAVLGNGVLAGTWNGFYQSSTGSAWSAVSPSGISSDTAIVSIAALDTGLFASSIGHVYRSSDGGSSWTEVSSGLPTSASVVSFTSSGSTTFAGISGSGVYASSSGSSTWTALTSGLGDLHVTQVAAVGSKLFAVTLNGLFVSSNGGTTWTADASGLKNVNCLATAGSQLLAGTDDSGVYASTDGGSSWTAASSGLPSGARVWSIATTGSNLFAGTDSGVWRMALASGADTQPPSAPSNLVWNASGGTVTLSWQPSTDDVGVADYLLYYGSFNLGAFTDSSLALIGFKPGTPYTFTVKARDAAGNVSVASNAVTVLLASGPDTTPPTAPTNLSATSVTSASVALRWTASTDDVGVVVYQVYVNGSLFRTVTTLTASVTGLSASTSYTFTVMALDAAGNTSSASAPLVVSTPPNT
jgi:chitodextrinase